jgi:hypothetical protein
MRAIILIVSLIGCAAVHADVVTVRLTPVYAISRHIESITGPLTQSSTTVSHGDPAQDISLDVAVRGNIPQSTVGELVRSALGAKSDFGNPGTQWAVSVVGDDKYAVVRVSMHCGFLCGGGASYLYAFTEGKWTFEYTYDEWVS